MALSNETELGINKDLGIEKVNTEHKGIAAGGLGSLTAVEVAPQDGLSCHCVNAACA